MNFRRILAGIAATFMLAGCSVHLQIGQPKRLVHVVCVWLKDSGDAAKRRQLLGAGDTLRAIPGLLTLSKGQCLPSKRPIVDSTYDTAFVMTFADAEAMQRYVDHPAHQKAVKEVLGPLAKKVVVYDFMEE